MAKYATVGATLPPDALMRIAFDWLPGGASPGAALRYIAYRAAGDPDARKKVMPNDVPLSDFDGRAAFEKTNVPAEVVDEIRRRHPGKSVSWALRFQYAKMNGARDNQAELLADGFKPGRPKGSKDSYQRTRRTKAELETNP